MRLYKRAGRNQCSQFANIPLLLSVMLASFTFSMPVISRWTRLQMRSPSWCEDLPPLHVQDFWRGKLAELVSRFGGARLREWLLRKNVRK
jgi:hypothetical protein